MYAMILWCRLGTSEFAFLSSMKRSKIPRKDYRHWYMPMICPVMGSVSSDALRVSNQDNRSRNTASMVLYYYVRVTACFSVQGSVSVSCLTPLMISMALQQLIYQVQSPRHKDWNFRYLVVRLLSRCLFDTNQV